MERPKTYKIKLISKKYVSESIIRVDFKLDDGYENLVFIPGQFVNLFVTPPYRRPYSVVEFLNGVITLLIDVRHEGKGSNYIKNSKVGDETSVMCFLGRFFYQKTNFKKVFISTGTGAAPFIPMITDLIESNGFNSSNLCLFNGMKYAKDDVAFDFLFKYIKSDSLNYTRCISRESHASDTFFNISGVNNFFGRVTDFITLNSFEEETEFYICGGDHVIKSVSEILLSKNIKKIYTENWG